MLDWLESPEYQSLRRAFAVWFGRIFLPKRLPKIPLPLLNDLVEIDHMLAENVDSWTDQWLEQGRRQGLGSSRAILIPTD